MDLGKWGIAWGDAENPKKFHVQTIEKEIVLLAEDLDIKTQWVEKLNEIFTQEFQAFSKVALNLDFTTNGPVNFFFFPFISHSFFLSSFEKATTFLLKPRETAYVHPQYLLYYEQGDQPYLCTRKRTCLLTKQHRNQFQNGN